MSHHAHATKSTDENSGAQLEVFYDGSCPLCRSEIAFLEKRDVDGALAFRDISRADGGADVAPGLSRDTAMARMHVRLPSGEIASGAHAFLEMWVRVGILRPVVRVLRVPPFPWILEGVYRAFLVVRPSLQRFARRRSGACSP